MTVTVGSCVMQTRLQSRTFVICSTFATIIVSGCVTDPSIEKIAVAQAACEYPAKSNSPWNIKNLYDCENRSLFIPYQLWTGADWDGTKDAPCMHPASSHFFVNGRSGTTIEGPKTWENPSSGEVHIIWERVKTNGSKTQRFACHDKGIGRVFDSRGPRYYSIGRCKFPAGYGWKMSERRHCRDTSIEITSVSLDDNNNLRSLTFKWWYGSTLDHIYRYKPNTGMVNAWQQ